MAASLTDISNWFDQGVKQKATHMIIVCDTYDYEDYPVFAYSKGEAREKYDNHNGVNMQRVMEVYNLEMDKEEQLMQRRVFNL